MKKYINFRPIAAVSLCIITGILFAFAYYKSGIVLLYLIFLFPIPLLYIKNRTFFYKTAIFIVVAMLAVSCGFFSFNGAIKAYKNAEKETKVYFIEGTVEDIKELEFNNRLTVTNLNIDGEKSSNNIKMYISGNIDFEIGDNISAYVKMYSFSAKKSDTRNLFKNILNKDRYFAYLNNEEITLEGESSDIFLSVKKKITDILNSGINDEASVLAKAMLLGETQDMEESLLENFRYGGIAHIFSISGLHIALIAAILIWLFKKFRLNKLLKAFLITLILLLYSGVCGFSVSSLRAVVMCGVYLFVKAAGNKCDSLNILFLSMIIVLLLTPVNLFDVGFQLSYSVTFFIIVFSSPFKRLFKFLPEKLSGLISVTLSASLGSLPLLLYYFGYVSLVSVLTNLIFAPILSFIFSMLFVCVLLCFIFPFYEVILFLPLKFLNLSQSLFMLTDYKALIIDGLKISVLLALVYYLILIVLSGKINLKKSTKAITAASMTFIFAACLICINIPNYSKAYIGMFKSGYGNYIIINYGNENVLISNGTGLNAYSLSKNNSQSGGGKIKYAVIVGNNPYNQINRIKSLFEIEKVFVNGKNVDDLSEFFDFPISYQTDEFTINKIKFSYNGDKSLKISLLSQKILYNAGGGFYEDIDENYSISIYNSFVEENKSRYNKTNTYFFNSADGFMNAESSRGLLFIVKNGRIVIS